MAKKKVEEVKEKEEVKEVKEKKTRTKKMKEEVKEAEPKEKKVNKRTKKVEEPKEEEVKEAEKVVIKEEEKAEAITVEAVETNEVTALAVFNNDELEILKKVIAEYRARTNTNNANTNTNNNTEKAKNFFENIDIPSEVRKIEYNTTLSIRGKQEIYDKIKEVAKKNGITASLLVNYLFYLVLKPLGEWEDIKK